MAPAAEAVEGEDSVFHCSMDCANKSHRSTAIAPATTFISAAFFPWPPRAEFLSKSLEEKDL
jgi:hypothetical protein